MTIVALVFKGAELVKMSELHTGAKALAKQGRSPIARKILTGSIPGRYENR